MAVLDVYETQDVVGVLWAWGLQLQQGFNDHCARLELQAGLLGLPPLAQWVFDADDPKRNGELFLRLLITETPAG